MTQPDPWNQRHADSTAALLSTMSVDSFGEISPSVYETARVATLAPWLTGHAERLRFLVRTQRSDGGWGFGAGYRLIPTLSATEALLNSLRHDPTGQLNRGVLVDSVGRALATVFDWLNGGRAITLPDTVAVEILVPALVAEINAHIAGLATEPVVGLDPWRGAAPLVPPTGTDTATLARLCDAARAGRTLPATLAHSLEVVGTLAEGMPSMRPVLGAVGCSPAATAAWLGARPPHTEHRDSVAYLTALQDRHGGPVPLCAPVPVFERSWVVAALTSAGFQVRIPAGVVDSLWDAFGEFGTSVGPGLPADADDTATALYALSRTGRPRSPDCLWAYQSGDHFSSFMMSERTWSTTTNAHVLQAFGACGDVSTASPGRYRAAVDRLAAWLCEQQRPDGSWTDKWHASPYYATASCAAALASYGNGSAAVRDAVRRAVAWVLATQHADGSWGRWQGTAEETAYGIRILLATDRRRSPDAATVAAARGCAFLLAADTGSGADSVVGQEYPPLWHDKDLYTPGRVVRAEITAALWLAHADGRVADVVARSEIRR